VFVVVIGNHCFGGVCLYTLSMQVHCRWRCVCMVVAFMHAMFVFVYAWDCVFLISGLVMLHFIPVHIQEEVKLLHCSRCPLRLKIQLHAWMHLLLLFLLCACLLACIIFVPLQSFCPLQTNHMIYLSASCQYVRVRAYMFCCTHVSGLFIYLCLSSLQG